MNKTHADQLAELTNDLEIDNAANPFPIIIISPQKVESTSTISDESNPQKENNSALENNSSIENTSLGVAEDKTKKKPKKEGKLFFDI